MKPHFHKLKNSFHYAGRGLRLVWASEQNFRLQFLAALLVILIALALELPAWKFVALFLVSVFVLTLELMNSLLERMIDVFAPRLQPAAEEMKDIMAGIVLLAALGAIVIGLILFWPHLVGFLS